jgi:hypothetical protein
MNTTAVNNVLARLSGASRALKQSAMYQQNDFMSAKREYLSAVTDLLNENQRTLGEISKIIDGLPTEIAQIDSSKPTIISYDSVKDEMYAEYDFMSIILFTKEILSSLKAGMYNSAYQIEDAKSKHIKVFFHSNDMSVEEKLDTFINSADTTSINDDERKGLEDLLRYKDRFVSRMEGVNKRLDDAVDIVIEALAGELPDKFSLEMQNEHRIHLTAVTSIIDIVNYALITEIVQIETVHRYLKCFSREAEETIAEMTVTESVDTEKSDFFDPMINSIVTDADRLPTYSIFANYDEMKLKDYRKINGFIEDIRGFLKLIGAKNVPDEKEMDAFRLAKDADSNVVSIKGSEKPKTPWYLDDLGENELVKFLVGQFGHIWSDKGEMLYQKLSNLVHPVNTFLSTSDPSAKNQLLNFIKEFKTNVRSPDPEESLKTTAVNLFVVSDKLIKAITGWIYDSDASFQNNINYNSSSWPHNGKHISDYTIYPKIKDLVILVYEEVVTALMLKYRYIEARLNDAVSLKTKHANEVISFDFPKIVFHDTRDSDILKPAVPTIQEMYYKTYDQASFEFAYESVSIASDYAKIIAEAYGFEYFEEGFKEIIDKVVAWFKGLIDKWKKFRINYELGVKWVTSHEQVLKAYQFQEQDSIGNVYQYNLQSPDAIFKGFSNLESLDPNNLQKDMAAFKDSLYPSSELAGLFRTETADSREKFSNWIKFGKTDKQQTVTISGSDLQKALQGSSEKPGGWIETVKNSVKYLDQVNAKLDIVNKTIEKLRSSSLSDTQTAAKPAASGSSTTSASTGAPEVKATAESVLAGLEGTYFYEEVVHTPGGRPTAETLASQPAQKSQQAKQIPPKDSGEASKPTPEPKVDNSAVFTEISSALTVIVNLSTAAIREVVLNEYKYLKEVHNKIIAVRSGQTQQATPQQAQAEQK